MQSKTRIYQFMKDDIYRKNIIFSREREKEMRDLEVIIAKYYFPNELFIGQVEEIISLLTQRLTGRFPHDQAMNTAKQIVTKYYLNIAEA